MTAAQKSRKWRDRTSYNAERQANLKEWMMTQTDKTIKHSAIRWACEQEDSVIRLMDLLNKCEQEGDCLIWNGATTRNYPVETIEIRESWNPNPRVSVPAHRLVFALANGIEALPEGKSGPKPDDLVIDHKCGNQLCIQPAHLQVITQEENIALRGKDRVAPPLSFGKLVA